MIIPDDITETGIALKDQFFDLNGLAVYSCLGKSSLRYHIKESGLPHYALRNEKGQITKILVKKSEFDEWMKKKWRDNLDTIVDEVIENLRRGG